MAHLRPHVSIRRGSLKIGGVSAGSLAARFGTPLYVTDLDRIASRYDEAISALRSKHTRTTMAFAYKSNSVREVVEVLTRRGAGAAVVSLAGLSLAKECGVDPGDIVFDGPSKTREELAAAVKARIGMINAESVDEVLDIESLCTELGVQGCRVGFRVNFGIRADTHAGLATGATEHKFGVSRKEVVRFASKVAPRLRRVKLVGLHSHIGSMVSDALAFRRQSEEMVSLAKELGQLGVEIQDFNLGGGLGIDYGGGKELTMEEYSRATAVILESEIASPDARLVVELGRWLVADSTVLLTKVNYLKTAGKVNWALVDAGMNDFIRPALYGAYHDIVPAQVLGRRPSKNVYDVGGPVCETTDSFGSDRRFGVELTRGDILGILDTGAYGFSMASTYNMRPLPRIALVSRASCRLARESLSYSATSK